MSILVPEHSASQGENRIAVTCTCAGMDPVRLNLEDFPLGTVYIPLDSPVRER